MPPGEILTLFDRCQRIEIVNPTMRREVVGGVVRHIDLTGRSSAILYADLDPANLGPVVREQIAYFSQIDHEVEWKTYSHDRPPDLHERLANYGFEPEEPEALMILNLRALPAVLARPSRHAIRRISDPVDLAEVRAIQEAVWGGDYRWLVDGLAAELRAAPEMLSIYVAEVNGRAAATAWIRFDGQGMFAGLWGGSTLLEHRGHGLYTDLLAIRAQEAIRRGARFLTIDAGPMSRPIVARLGFKQVSSCRACLWRPRAS